MSSCIVIKEIMPCQRDISEDEALIEVIAAEIDPKHASSLLIQLSENLPLEKYSLSHLKRIRKNMGNLEILLCPKTCEVDIPISFHEFFKQMIQVQVMKFPIENRKEFEKYSKFWPLNVRLTDSNKSQNNEISSDNQQLILRYLSLVDVDAKNITSISSQIGGGCILVNPENNKVVTSSFEAFKHLHRMHGECVYRHSFYSPTMLCIEGIAAIIRGDLEITGDSLDVLPPDHYLCTGLDLYLTYEPDLMSSMALIHSRIRTVYYMFPNPEAGAVGTHFNLHALKSLNHHFKVFRVFTNNGIEFTT